MLDFWQYVHEREMIRKKRVIGEFEPPWTGDKVLQTCHFTNVFREDDPGTWVAQDIMKGYTSIEERLWNLVLYRRLNRESTYLQIGGYQRRMTKAALERKLRAIEGPVFTGAHQVNMLQMVMPGRDAIERQAEAMAYLRDSKLKALDKALKKSRDIKDMFEYWLNAKIPGIGKFLAWQLALDVNVVYKWPENWAPVQAGAAAGLTIVAPHITTKHGREIELLLMVKYQKDEFKSRGLKFDRLLTPAAVEHSLCEYSKYHRIALGGHAKGKFNGE